MIIIVQWTENNNLNFCSMLYFMKTTAAILILSWDTDFMYDKQFLSLAMWSVENTVCKENDVIYPRRLCNCVSFF
jgi:hypothetical protein